MVSWGRSRWTFGTSICFQNMLDEWAQMNKAAIWTFFLKFGFIYFHKISVHSPHLCVSTHPLCPLCHTPGTLILVSNFICTIVFHFLLYFWVIDFQTLHTSLKQSVSLGMCWSKPIYKGNAKYSFSCRRGSIWYFFLFFYVV